MLIIRKILIKTHKYQYALLRFKTNNFPPRRTQKCKHIITKNLINILYFY